MKAVLDEQPQEASEGRCIFIKGTFGRIEGRSPSAKDGDSDQFWTVAAILLSLFFETLTTFGFFRSRFEVDHVVVENQIMRRVAHSL